MTEFEGKIMASLARIEEQFNPIKNDIEGLKVTVYGDDSANRQGIKIKIDRLEQIQVRHSWVATMLGGGVLAGFAKAVWDIFYTGGHKP